MPTERHGKVRRLLKEGKAKVVKKTPFTIQLLYDTTEYVQDITLGIDAGSKTIGVSATTEKKEFYSGEVALRYDVSELISAKSAYRHTRRNRKTRYRKARFNNRKKGEGWIAPSVQQKIQTHIQVIDNINKILPISKIVIETASFDIQKIKNPNITGKEYSEGEQLGFWNVREYVLFRDNHTCQCCKGKSKDPILNVHHIESRKTGGNAPNNLITLCETCHKGHHKGTVTLPSNIKRGMNFKDATFMGIMRWAFYEEVKEKYNNVYLTYGYITKNTRIENNLPKTHYIDARCITGHPNAKPLGYYFYQKKIRCHNRKIHKATIYKGGAKKLEELPYKMFGFRNYDKVVFEGVECFVNGRRKSGAFTIKTLDGTKIKDGITYKKLKFLENRTTLPTEIKRSVS